MVTRHRLVITDEAELDIAEAYRWYEEQAGLGRTFLDAVGIQLGMIQSHPFACAAIAYEVRRSVIRRFPYNLYYAVNGEFIDILAIWHGSRDQERLLASRLGTDR